MKQKYVIGIIMLVGIILISGCVKEPSPAGLCLVGIEGYLFSVVEGNITTNYLVRAYKNAYEKEDQPQILTQDELEDWMENTAGTRDITLSICVPEVSESEAMEIVNCLMEHKPYRSMPGVKSLEFISLVHSISDGTYCAYRFHGKDENGKVLCIFDVNAKTIDDPLCTRKITRGGCLVTGPKEMWGYEFITKTEATELMKNYLEKNDIQGELLPDVYFISYSHPC